MRRLLLALLAATLLHAPAAAQKRIALTFDDAPRGRGAFMTPQQRSVRLVAALRKAGVRQAAFFVNPGNLAKDDGKDGEVQLARYVAAGHVIANHSFSHPALTDLTAEAYLADIDQADLWLRPRAGFRPWFRFPFLNEGRSDKVKRDAVRAGLAARGLRNGYVTVDGNDWQLEQLTVDARRAGQRMDRRALRQLYVETHVEAAEFYDRLAIKATGRSPAHVLLMHETDLAALFLPDLVKALHKRGWTIVTADEAFADPIGADAATVDVPSAQGTLTEALAWAKGLPAPRWYERNNTSLLERLFRERVLKQPAGTPQQTSGLSSFGLPHHGIGQTESPA